MGLIGENKRRGLEVRAGSRLRRSGSGFLSFLILIIIVIEMSQCPR
jgi:hypothetical protein